jgi:uncharacterized protein YjbI with pentapeptide repeats
MHAIKTAVVGLTAALAISLLGAGSASAASRQYDVRAQLDGADLTGADLKGSDLTNADLRGADLSHAVFRDADLTGVKCDDATVWPDGTRHHGTNCPSAA